MKTRIIKALLIMVMTFYVVPIFAQDALVVFFNDGTFRKFYLREIEEISTSQFDKDGTKHNDYEFQHIRTISDKFVYDLNTINCIAFSKYDETKAEQNFVDAMPKVVNALSDCETINDAEAQIEQIKDNEGVEDAWSDGHLLYVKIEEGETFSFHFDHSAAVNDNWIESDEYQNLAKAMVSKAKKAGASGNSKLKAVIANQQYKDEDESRADDRRKYQEPLLQAFLDCGIEADYVINPTVDFFYDNSNDPQNRHIYDYDIILLITHGSYLEPKYLAQRVDCWGSFYDDVANYDLKCHAIATAEEIDNLPVKGKYEDNWKDCYAKFKAWRDKSQFRNVSDIDLSFEFIKEIRGGEERWIAHPLLTEYFFRHIATGRFPDNSILFNTACQSLLGDYSFANELFNKNLSVYLGYTESNFFGGGILPQFFKMMLIDGSSIGKVFDTLPAIYKVESTYNDAELKILPEGNDKAKQRFLFNVYTNEADQTAVTNEYNTDNAVTISCTLTALEPTMVKAGFEYGTDKNNLSKNKAADSYSKIENQGKGNYVFTAKLTDIQPGNTYYCRAYTYDGMYHNYGEPVSFTIQAASAFPDLQLSQTQLSIVKGSSTTVQITAGSGEYGVTNLNSSIAKATLQGTTITINALAVGEAKVVVTDMKTGKMATITVTVAEGSTPTLTPGQAIDLGLPSGLKWASCNVGANSPEDYGGYYAWGETEEKDVYSWSTYIHCDDDIGSCISGTQYDVAHVKWGGKWRMPTKDEMRELGRNCSSEWIQLNGIKGKKFTGPNGNSIFLPKAGYREGKSLLCDSIFGGYWSGTLDPDDSSGALILGFGGYTSIIYKRHRGFTVRPVFGDIADLAISTNAVSMKVGSSTAVQITAGSGDYSYTNNDMSVVTVSLQGNTLTLTALKAGDTQVVVTDRKTQKTATISVTVTEGGSPTLTPGQAIDLGLPSGIKWASCNVGATCPEEFGGYYAWGETEEKDYYDWSTYIHCDGSKETCHDIGNNISGTKYDVAHVMWSGSWRMPTYDEFKELVNNCSYEWTQLNGVNGAKFTGPNGNTIFLPAAGGRREGSLNDAGNCGFYWSGTLLPANTYAANCLYFQSNYATWVNIYSDEGFTVRPVSEDFADLAISTNAVSMEVGSSTTVQITAGNGDYSYTNNDMSVVTVSLQGNTLTLTALKAGDTQVVVTDRKTQKTATISVTVTEGSSPTLNPGQAIDLGLPSGIKWASCNVGATSPEEYGGYYAWGETEEKDYYDWSTYIYCDGSDETCHDIGSNISGTQYDVAHVKWGGKWRMPTIDEVDELLNNCTSEWTQLNGVNGRKFTGPNGNTIFLPAAGDRWEDGLYDEGSYGGYWSGSLDPSCSSYAYSLIFGSDGAGWDYWYRSSGFTVRPVSE